MAKCIRDANGNIKRVSDELAFKKVNAGSHEYCSKSDWKKAVRIKE